MILVAGLGNPGARYAETRHNLGYLVADRLFSDMTGATWRKKFSGDFAQGDLGGVRMALLKPTTYMNRSGESVATAASFFKVDPTDVLVVHDELDLPFGEVRLKKGGGEAGHNGVRSVSQHLGTRDYARLRLGVGKPPPEFRGSGADFVLQGFAPAERGQVGDLVDRASRAAVLVIERGLDEAMNETNRRVNT